MDRAKSWRRAAAIGVAGVIALSSAALAQTAPPLAPGVHFRAIKIDVEKVAQNGGPTAQWLAHALPGPLEAAFKGRVAPGDASAPTLVVRVDSVFLGESDNGILGPTAAVEARDLIQGAGVVVGPNGQTLGVYPLFAALDNFTGGSNYEMGTEQRRVGELANSFAYWLPGQMGL
jgi:hypothetical protein